MNLSEKYLPKLKALGLVCFGMGLASVGYWAKTPTGRESAEPLGVDVSYSAGGDSVPAIISANPRPEQTAAKPDRATPESVSISVEVAGELTDLDQKYLDAVLAGLATQESFAEESVFCGRINEWIQESPAVVESSIGELAQRFGSDVALRVTAQLWAETDPDGAMEWALKSGNGGQRLKLIASVAYQLALRNPLAAIESVKAELARTPYYEAAASPLIAQWAVHDRVAASAWVNGQPEGDVRDQLLWRINSVSPTVDQRIRQ